MNGPLDRAKGGVYACGVIPSRPSPLIVGGRPSEPGKYPWLAAVICPDCFKNSTSAGNPWGLICGGSLITDR